MQQTVFLLDRFSFSTLMFEMLQGGTQQHNYRILMRLYDLFTCKKTPLYIISLINEERCNEKGPLWIQLNIKTEKEFLCNRSMAGWPCALSLTVHHQLDSFGH